MPPELMEPGVGTAGTDTPPPSLRDTLSAAIEANPIEAPQPDRETREQTQHVPTALERARDASGRFTPKQLAEAAKGRDGAEVPSAKEVKAAEAPLPEEAPQEPHPDLPVNTDNAPKSWKAGVREKWVNLDPEVRAEVHRREREMIRSMNESAPIKKFTADFQQIIQPHAARYQGTGMSPLQVVHNLMNADAALSTAPMAQRAAFMAKLINDYGIDITMLDSALSGDDPAREPLSQVESIIDKKLAPLQAFVQSTQQRRQQAEQREYSEQENHIERMVQDSANFPHMELVALDMADIMEMNSRRQVYLTPEEAYKRAVAMNPEAQAAEQGRAGQQRARVAHDAATRSLGASLSVNGSPAGLKQPVAPDDLRGTIAAAWEAAQGR